LLTKLQGPFLNCGWAIRLIYMVRLHGDFAGAADLCQGVVVDKSVEAAQDVVAGLYGRTL
jgi:hypothetical protein